METNEENIVKNDLKKSADSYKAQLEVEVHESLEELQRMVKNAAVVAGGALLGYAIYKIFFESKEAKEAKESKKRKKKKKSKNTGRMDFFEPVIKAGAEVAATFLLSIARQKLIEYLHDLDQTFESSNEHPERDQ